MIKQVKGYKAIIFDLDGTIADTMPLHYQASQEICNRYGFDFPLDYFYSQAGRPTVDVFIDLMKIMKNGLDGKQLAEDKEARFIELLPTVKPIAPVLEVAEFYHKKIPLAIGSGGQSTAVHSTLQALKIDYLFSSIVTADDVKNHKPHPDTFLKCAESMGIKPENCVVFEDGPPGIIAAKKSCMGVIDVREFL